ncbi:transposase, partial [Streptomyces mirabilis]|uniref:transposase n=1 Tax=Streptomyces mirabilis TaxID=68239 RepID=UPI003F756CEC
MWNDELEELFLRTGHRFRRVEPRRRMRDYIRGLLGPVGRKNSWQLAEYAGHRTPDRLQRLLNGARWEADDLRDDLQHYVAERLGEPNGIDGVADRLRMMQAHALLQAFHRRPALTVQGDD